MTETPELILVIDDEQDLLDVVSFGLQREGFRTETAATGASALERLASPPIPDLVILDLMLPDLSGMEVCRRLRQAAETAVVPVMILTAKSDEIDRVVGFELGADDYLAKPFSTRELMLRVRAILRRSRPIEAEREDMRFESLRVDVHGHRVWVEEREIELTALEFRLLCTLLSRRGRVQSRERLLEDVWEMRSDIGTRTVDTHVLRLRKKLGDAGEYIETLRGVGYRFVTKG